MSDKKYRTSKQGRTPLERNEVSRPDSAQTAPINTQVRQAVRKATVDERPSMMRNMKPAQIVTTTIPA